MSHNPKPVTVQNTNWTTVISIGAMTGIFIIFVLVLWKAGFLSFSGDDPSSKVVAAALALVGGLVAAIGTIVGVLLKYSIDQRTESRLQIEADRANALQTQAEQRLNLEAAIRAVELLGSAEGEVSALKRAGALYALSTLNQHELTLDLTAYLLERKDLEPAVACTLINRALKRDDQDIQSDAIMLLYENAERMCTATGINVPESIFRWDERFTSTVREWAPLALVRILMSRPLSDWQNEFSGEASAIVAILGLAWESESDDRLKADVGAMLNCIISGLELGILHHPTKAINTEQLLTEVKDQQARSKAAVEIVKKLNAWKSAEPVGQVKPAIEVKATPAPDPRNKGMQLLYLSLPWNDLQSPSIQPTGSQAPSANK